MCPFSTRRLWIALHPLSSRATTHAHAIQWLNASHTIKRTNLLKCLPVCGGRTYEHARTVCTNTMQVSRMQRPFVYAREKKNEHKVLMCACTLMMHRLHTIGFDCVCWMHTHKIDYSINAWCVRGSTQKHRSKRRPLCWNMKQRLLLVGVWGVVCIGANDRYESNRIDYSIAAWLGRWRDDRNLLNKSARRPVYAIVFFLQTWHLCSRRTVDRSIGLSVAWSLCCLRPVSVTWCGWLAFNSTTTQSLSPRISR